MGHSLIATPLASYDVDERLEVANLIRALFKPYGWTGSKPEKWGYLANPTGFHSGSLPYTLVGKVDGKVVASASLVRRDHADMDCGPWLAGLVVHPDYRQSGIGSFLIRDIELHAEALFASDHPDVTEGRIYLSTERTINSFDSVAMYARRGWKFLTDADAHKREDILMYKSICD